MKLHEPISPDRGFVDLRVKAEVKGLQGFFGGETRLDESVRELF